MVEKKRKPYYVKPTLVNNSARYKIGGKEYTSDDVSRLKPQAREGGKAKGTGTSPNYGSRKQKEQSGAVNTKAGTVAPSQSVHSQSETYKPSANTQASVQKAPAPQNNTYKPSITMPITPSPAPTGGSGAKTGSDVTRTAESRIQAQTDNYYSTNAVEAVRTPRTVDAIKTGAAPSVQTGSSPKIGPQPMPAAQPVKTQVNQPSPTPASPAQTPSVPGMGSPNIKTTSQVNSAVERSVQAQTQNFHSNNAFSTERTEIRSGIERTPRTVDMVKTAAPLTGKQQPAGGIHPTQQGAVKTGHSGNEQPGSSFKPGSQPGAAVQGIKPAVVNPSQTPTGPAHTPAVPGMGSPNIKTTSQVNSAVERSVQAQTQNFHSNNAFSTERTEIRSGIERTPRTVDMVKTAAPLTGKQQPVGGIRPTQQGAVKTGISGNTPGTNPAHAPVTAKGIPTSHITVQGAGNIRTASQMANVVEQKVRIQTANFHSNNAVVAGIKQIQNNGSVVPRNAGGIQTGMNLPQGGTSAYRPNVPMIGAGSVGTIALSKGQITDLKANMKRLGISDKVTTGNVQHGENVARAFNMTGKAREGKIFTEINTGKRLMDKFATGTESNREFLRSLGATAKYTIGTEAAQALQKWKTGPKRNELLSGGKMLLGKAEGELLSEDDIGTQSAGGVIAVGMLGVTGFKGAQAATEIGIETVKKVGNAAYQVITTAGRASITVGMTVKTIIQTQTLPLSKQAIDILRAQAQISGLNNAKIVKGIVSKAHVVKTAFHNAAANVKKVGTTVATGARTVKTAVDTTVRIVHGVAAGTLSVNLVKAQIEAFRHRMFKGIQTGVVRGIKTAAGYAVRGAAKGIGVTVFRGLPKAGRLLRGGIMTAAGAMMHSEDWAVQGVGTAITTAEIGIKIGVKTTVAGAKATGYTVKTAVKGGKAVAAGYRFIKNYGLNAAWQRARILARQKVFQLGRSVVSALIQGAKMLVGKYVVPLLVILLIVLLASGALSGLATAVGTIFGGVFQLDGSTEEISFQEHLIDPVKGVPPLADDFKQQLAAEIENSKHSYDIVRFYSDLYQIDVLDPSYAGVSAGMPTNEQLAGILQPLLHALVLVKYDLQPTDQEISDLIETMFNELFLIEEAASTEQCGQAIRNGEGDPIEPCNECAEIHALDDCPNPITGTHRRYTCGECDREYYVCKGHEGERNCGITAHTHGIGKGCYDTICGLNHTHEYSCLYFACGLDGETWHFHDEYCYDLICWRDEHSHSSWRSATNEGCYDTEYCADGDEMASPCGNSRRYFECSGYRHCGTHSVYTYVLHINGLTKLVKENFTDPIAELEVIAGRTEEQEEELQQLKDGYEVLQVLIEEADSLNLGDVTGAGGSYGNTTSVFYGGSGLMTPVNFTALTSPFGWRIHPTEGEEHFHTGVDLAAPEGTPIYAAADGTVTAAYYDSDYGGGNTVIIVHDDGYQTGYCHMVAYIVSAGQEVKQGDCIGYVGNTGVSTGPHLHLTVRLDGERVNPEQHIDLNWKPGDDGFASENA